MLFTFRIVMFRILNCIVAVCPDMGIGKNGNLPWHPIRLRWARSRSLLLLTLHVLLYWYNHIKSVFQDQRVMSFVFCNSYKLLLVCSDMFNIYKSMLWQFFKMTIHKLIKWKRLTKSLRQNGRNNNISNMKSNILWFHRSWELELCPAEKKKNTWHVPNLLHKASFKIQYIPTIRSKILLSYIFSNEFKHFQKMTMTASVEGNTVLSYLSFLLLSVYFISLFWN